MQTNPRITRIGATFVTIVCFGNAQSEPNPYYLGASQAFTHENNLFRAPSGQPKTSDTYSTTSLLAGLNQPIGRQRIFGNAALRYNKYQDQTQLDNTGYSLKAGLDWATINKLSGLLSYALNQNLAKYGADEGPLITRKNLERSQELIAKGQYGGDSLLSLNAQYLHRQLDYSAPEYAYQELRQDTGGVGIAYRPSGLLTLGVGYRRTHGRYPSALQMAGVTQEDQFDRDDYDLTAVWVPTGLSRVSARISYTNEDHDQIQSRNYSGTTGEISWEYRPTGKLTFITDLVRDTGAEGVFSPAATANQGSGVTPTGNQSRLSNAVQVRASYQATAKIAVESLARYVRRDLVNTFALANGGNSVESGSDKYALFTLGATYKPLRSLTLGCDFGWEKRTSNSSSSYPYIATKFGCLGQFTLGERVQQ